jgi:hypothetical protein
MSIAVPADVKSIFLQSLPLCPNYAACSNSCAVDGNRILYDTKPPFMNIPRGWIGGFDGLIGVEVVLVLNEPAPSETVFKGSTASELLEGIVQDAFDRYVQRPSALFL